VHRWEKIYQSKLPSTRYTYRFIDSGSIGDRRSCDRKLVTCTFQVIDYSSYSRCTLGSRNRFGKYRYDETHIGLHSYKAIVTLYCNNHHAYTLLHPYIYTRTHTHTECMCICVCWCRENVKETLLDMVKKPTTKTCQFPINSIFCRTQKKVFLIPQKNTVLSCFFGLMKGCNQLFQLFGGSLKTRRTRPNIPL
jgi:hypothetical protein